VTGLTLAALPDVSVEGEEGSVEEAELVRTTDVSLVTAMVTSRATAAGPELDGPDLDPALDLAEDPVLAGLDRAAAPDPARAPGPAPSRALAPARRTGDGGRAPGTGSAGPGTDGLAPRTGKASAAAPAPSPDPSREIGSPSLGPGLGLETGNLDPSPEIRSQLIDDQSLLRTKMPSPSPDLSPSPSPGPNLGRDPNLKALKTPTRGTMTKILRRNEKRDPDPSQSHVLDPGVWIEKLDLLLV